MINIVILEDEPAALSRLKRLLKIIRPHYVVLGDADSVEDGVDLLIESAPDLIISDIQLADGLSFDIFKKSRTKAPIIFVTAYDQYAIESFDFNGIYYVLKPITEASLNKALQKFETNPLYAQASQKILELIEQDEFNTRKRIISKVGAKSNVIEVQDIALVYSENKMNKVVTFSGRKYLVDYTLDELMVDMPETIFFKISRQIIVNAKAVKIWAAHSSGRLLLTTEPFVDIEIIVSKEKTPRFKSWIKSLKD